MPFYCFLYIFALISCVRLELSNAVKSFIFIGGFVFCLFLFLSECHKLHCWFIAFLFSLSLRKLLS